MRHTEGSTGEADSSCFISSFTKVTKRKVKTNAVGSVLFNFFFFSCPFMSRPQAGNVRRVAPRHLPSASPSSSVSNARREAREETSTVNARIVRLSSRAGPAASSSMSKCHQIV